VVGDAVTLVHELTEARGGDGAELFRFGGDSREGEEWRARVRGEVSARSSHLCMHSRRGGTGRARTPHGSAALSSVATTASPSELLKWNPRGLTDNVILVSINAQMSSS
jgi:hypothetical protein